MASWFTRASTRAAVVTGHYLAFVIAFAIILIWAVTGPLFRFSDTWQLVINTGTTIVTFLMVFLIQHTQNRDTMAIHLKLDELINVSEAADNAIMHADDESDEDLADLKRRYRALSQAHQALKERIDDTLLETPEAAESNAESR